MVCSWAGPEFRDKIPFWARDKYIPARYLGLEWDEKEERYVAAHPGLETEPPRNTRGAWLLTALCLLSWPGAGNINYGDKNWGKVPQYLKKAAPAVVPVCVKGCSRSKKKATQSGLVPVMKALHGRLLLLLLWSRSLPHQQPVPRSLTRSAHTHTVRPS